MIPAEFDYAAPRTLDEATRLLAGTPGAKVLAGGMSLIPALKHRLTDAPLLVDIGRVAGLDGITHHGARIRIGGRATHARVGASPELAGVHVFAETARVLGEAALPKTIVLTGAMIPYAFGSSDGLFNLGSALSFVQVLPHGVYVAMNGRYFTWDDVRKNRGLGVFETLK